MGVWKSDGPGGGRSVAVSSSPDLTAVVCTEVTFWHPVSEKKCDSNKVARNENLISGTNQKGYGKLEITYEKLSAGRIQMYWVYFRVIIF